MTALQHRLAQQQDELLAQGLAKAEAAASLSALEGDMDFLKQEHVAALAENAELQARLAWNMPPCSSRQACVPHCGSEGLCFPSSQAAVQCSLYKHWHHGGCAVEIKVASEVFFTAQICLTCS